MAKNRGVRKGDLTRDGPGVYHHRSRRCAQERRRALVETDRRYWLLTMAGVLESVVSVEERKRKRKIRRRHVDGQSAQNK